MRHALLALSASVTLWAVAASAQTDPAVLDSLALAPVEVTASPFTLGRAPLSLTVRWRTEAERVGDPGVSLDGLGRGIPGVWISDRGNPSVGERVLVRGLGWRAAFGVRGTHVLLDGVPLTLADGQTPLTVVDGGLVDRVEAIRGPASTFWGSGSAGVLSFSTRQDGPRVRARALGGAYGLARVEASARPDLGGRRRLVAWGSAIRQDGYRQQSALRALRGGLTGGVDLGSGRSVGVVALGAVVPRAESPGGISVMEAAQDPRQTRDIAITQDAHKAVSQASLALDYRQPVGGARLRATLTGGARSLDNPIIPRVIVLDRVSGGARVVVEGGERIAWGVGTEIEGQRDDRLETDNVGGVRGAEVLTDQVETVRSGAVFARLAVPVGGAVTVTGALRADAIRYDAEGATGDLGGQTVTALSPSLGVSAFVGGATVYANVARALDAPTTTELGNRPDGSPGFNPDLRPERSVGGEIGARMSRPVRGGRVSLDVAAFVARVDDLLSPFEVDDVTVYRNQGRAVHRGAEAGVQADALTLGPVTLDGAVALTFARGTFEDGAPVPGFPPSLVTGTVTARVGVLALGADGEAASSYAASRGGQGPDGYGVLHLRLALSDLGRGSARATPFLTLRNAFGADYSGSVVVNAFGGRFLEPAPGRHVVAGLAVTFD